MTETRWAKRLRSWVINIVLIVVIVGAVQWWKTRPLITGEAPMLTGISLDGLDLRLADFQGQPVLVHFWASWCPVCTAMDGAIDSIARDHPVVTVAMQSGEPGELQDVMRKAGQDFPTMADPTGEIASEWGVVGVPTTFVIDSAGQIRYSTVGVSTEPGLRLRLWLAGRQDQ